MAAPRKTQKKAIRACQIETILRCDEDCIQLSKRDRLTSEMVRDTGRDMTAAERQNRIIQDFGRLRDWEEKYKKIIDLGKALTPFPEAYRTEDNKVRGCQSQVWLFARIQDGKVELLGDSDALIVKGLVALLLEIYSGANPEEILKLEPEFIEKLGFASNLSPSRTNGLFSMIKQIKLFAQAFYMMQKIQKPKS